MASFLAGCGVSEHGAILHARQMRGSHANLALGPSAEHLRLAQRLAVRSDWPSVETGYRLDDVTFYMTAIYDEQSYYDRYGSLFHDTQSLQTGVRLR